MTSYELRKLIYRYEINYAQALKDDLQEAQRNLKESVSLEHKKFYKRLIYKIKNDLAKAIERVKSNGKNDN